MEPISLTRPLVTMTALPVPEEITKHDLLPLRFSCFIAQRYLHFEIAYNDYGHFFTLSIANDDGQPLVSGALQYGVDFCKPFQHIRELRGMHIVPFDIFLKHKVITPENFGREVLLYYSVDQL